MLQKAVRDTIFIFHVIYPYGPERLQRFRLVSVLRWKMTGIETLPKKWIGFKYQVFSLITLLELLTVIIFIQIMKLYIL